MNLPVAAINKQTTRDSDLHFNFLIKIFKNVDVYRWRYFLCMAYGLFGPFFIWIWKKFSIQVFWGGLRQKLWSAQNMDCRVISIMLSSENSLHFKVILDERRLGTIFTSGPFELWNIQKSEGLDFDIERKSFLQSKQCNLAGCLYDCLTQHLLWRESHVPHHYRCCHKH